MTIERANRRLEHYKFQTTGSITDYCHVFAHEAVLPNTAPEDFLAFAWQEIAQGERVLLSGYKNLFERAGYGYTLQTLTHEQQLHDIIYRELPKQQTLGAILHVRDDAVLHALGLYIQQRISSQPEKLVVADTNSIHDRHDLYSLYNNTIRLNAFVNGVFPQMAAYAREFPKNGNIAMIYHPHK